MELTPGQREQLVRYGLDCLIANIALEQLEDKKPKKAKKDKKPKKEVRKSKYTAKQRAQISKRMKAMWRRKRNGTYEGK